jgi:predicted nucleotidyltransferase
MYLTNEQFDKLRSWAQHTSQIEEAYLFGSYAKGEADGGSDVDVAIKASASNWADLIATWQKAANSTAWSEGQHSHPRQP